MSLLQNSNAISAAGGYNITNSLRFRSSANAYLSRTFTTPTNNKIWTWSAWVKRSNIGTAGFLFSTVSGTTEANIRFDSSDRIYVLMYNSGFVAGHLLTSQVFRDSSAWYHITVVWDTTNATSTDRLKLYVNGTRVTSFTSTTSPSLNQTSRLNSAVPHYIGNYNTSLYDFDGYITEVNFVDGQALTPSDFGETNDDGVWSPKKYTGTYGTNGFYLPMKETTQATGFNTVLWTGNGGTQSISNVGFSPDLIWSKVRSDAGSNTLFDTIRGANYWLETNTTDAEENRANSLTSFDSDGFTLGSDTRANYSGRTYVAWCWDAGSSTVSNTDGTITSSVRANPDYGFSIVTWTHNGTAFDTVGHGLGTKPQIVIQKLRSNTGNWAFFTDIIDGSMDYLYLNTTAAAANTSNITPTSSYFGQIGGTSGWTAVAYCFAEIAGYSKFGSYTGNGSTSGPTVTTGFRPAFVMVKRTDTTGSWRIFDSTRSVDNPRNDHLKADASDAESVNDSALAIDFNDTGFQLVGTGLQANASGGTYIYMAFADTRDYQWNFDASGNKNNWTPNNINSNASSETTYDLMSDVPSLADEDTGNFATYNVLFPLSTSTLQSGNQKLSNAGTTSWRHAISSIALPKTGKWYFEMVSGTDSNNGTMGLAPVESLANGSNAYVTDAILTNTPDPSGTASGGLAGSTGTWTGTYNISAYDALACAVDMDANKVWFRIGSNWVNAGSGAGDPSAGTNPAVSGGINSSKTYHFVTSAYDQNHWVNFGQRPFQYTVPTGFKKLNTYNLPDSSITDGSQYFDVDTWSGDSSATTQIATPFSPDFVWIKNRSNTGGSGSASHMLYDTVRGVQKELQTNLTSAEGTLSTGLNSFDSDGYKPGTSTRTNATGNTYVGWSWRGSDSAPVSNTDGTITSTVSANPTSGFSVVTYTGNGSTNQTVGHGLGQTPKVIIYKDRSASTAWRVIPAFINDGYYLALNDTSAMVTVSTSYFGTNTSTTLGISGSNSGIINASGNNIVAYAFAEVEGFSKFGSYTGNGSADGPFVYTGFRPAFLLIKQTSASGNYWVLQDSTRSQFNEVDDALFPNLSNAETVVNATDFLSNGFKIRNTGSNHNTSGSTYIYMAFAENPFKNSLGR